MKQRIQSVVRRPHGEAGNGRQRTHTALSTEATSAMAATERASGAPGEVPVWSRVDFTPPTYQRFNIFYFHFMHAITTVITFDGLGDSAANPK